jgi:hypothetical protein
MSEQTMHKFSQAIRVGLWIPKQQIAVWNLAATKSCKSSLQGAEDRVEED